MNLTMKNVCYAYKNNASHQVLNNINYDFEIGKVYAICGPSGSGKTTILSLLGGLDTPQSGQIYLNNIDIKQPLASPAPFILADEPTGNLDEENATVIMDIFKKLANTQNKGIIIVTHSKSVAKLADVTLALSKNGLKVLNKSK
ncbi:ATP-binding cassette domain-containing protein [Erysipelothrix sp. Poltava]|nr:ATP-binding cassette domain-containing protein [Erysipelothrix sp. Poltava]